MINEMKNQRKRLRLSLVFSQKTIFFSRLKNIFLIEKAGLSAENIIFAR